MNLKINEKSCRNFGMRLLSGCQYHTNFSRSLRSLDIFKSIRFSFLNTAIQNHLFFIIKQESSHLFNNLCNISVFAFYIALYDQRKVEFHTLNIHGNLTIDHGIIMKKTWNFISYFLSQPCKVTGHFVPRSFRTHFVPNLVISYLLLLFDRKPFWSFRTYFL